MGQLRDVPPTGRGRREVSAEGKIQDAFAKWLTDQNIYFIRPRMDARSTIRKGAPDFHIIHCNRALLIECKTEKTKRTKEQIEVAESLVKHGGTVIYICRSIEECVNFAREWLGTLPPMNVPAQQEKPRGEAPERTEGQFTELRIGAWGGTQWLYGKDRKQTWTGIRPATTDDIAKYSSR